jgi:G3E family GTPase
MRDTAVVINEFGEIGLDHLLVAASPDDVVQLPNGCLCCAVRQDLVRTLHGLLARRAAAALPPFRRMVVETSGLAEPAPILYTLAADAHLEQALRFDTVLTVVDALAGLATLEGFAEATAQAVVADRLLISKTDLAPASEALLSRLAAINPSAEIAAAVDLVQPGAALFRGPGAAPTRPAPRFWSAGAHSHGISTLAIALRREMTRLDFARALGGLARERGEDLLRVKGIIAFADVPGRPAAVHAVQHTLYPPEWFAEWPDADRRSRLVFITRDIAPGEILSRFAAGAPELLA